MLFDPQKRGFGSYYYLLKSFFILYAELISILLFLRHIRSLILFIFYLLFSSFLSMYDLECYLFNYLLYFVNFLNVLILS